MIKKVGVIIISLIFLFAFFTIIPAENETTTATNSVQQQNLSKIDKAYSCLENKTRGKCSTLSNIQEIALVMLASPTTAVRDECKSVLMSKKGADCFPSGNCNIKDTALAVLALNAAGENTDVYENYLISKNKTSSDLVWYLEQDSNSATQCKISYSSNDYTITVRDNKKIESSNIGNCFTLSQSGFWLQVSPNCYDTEFSVSCDKDFIATFLYQQSSPSSPFFVLSDTPSKPALGTVNLKIKAKCFSTTSICDYESTAWAALALLKTENNIEDYIPYLIATSDSNKMFLPDSFIYMITNYQDYGTRLIQTQELGSYWQAESSAYDRFYDTGLALLSLKQSTAEQVIKAKDWLLFQQDTSTGCWQTGQNTIKDTAMILWAIGTRYLTPIPDAGTSYCTSANYYCIPSAECPDSQKLSNFFCPGLSTSCCQTENLQSCSSYSGIVCEQGKVCTGNTRDSLDAPDNCCLGECINPVSVSECESEGHICSSSCSSNQEPAQYSCNSGVCCKLKTTPSSGSSWWIWVLIIAIILIIAVILFLIRDKIKLFWFKSRKTKPEAPSTPPRPGFPPLVRPMMSRQVQRPQPQQRKDTMLDDTFKKLRDMSK